MEKDIRRERKRDRIRLVFVHLVNAIIMFLWGPFHSIILHANVICYNATSCFYGSFVTLANLVGSFKDASHRYVVSHAVYNVPNQDLRCQVVLISLATNFHL